MSPRFPQRQSRPSKGPKGKGIGWNRENGMLYYRCNCGTQLTMQVSVPCSYGLMKFLFKYIIFGWSFVFRISNSFIKILMYHIVPIRITKSSYNLKQLLEPFAVRNNKMLYNSGDRYISKTVRAMEKRTSDVESTGSVTPYMKFLDHSKYIFCWVKSLAKIYR